MKIDPVNWRREMKNFVGNELIALKKEISQLRADMAGTSTASTEIMTISETTTDLRELATLKQEISLLRKDFSSFTEMVKSFSTNQTSANVEREISTQIDSAKTVTELKARDIISEIQELKDNVSNLRKELLSAINNIELKNGGDDYSNNYNNDYNSDETYYSQSTTVRNRMGVHARPASVFVGLASKFDSKIWIETRDKKVDARNILMLMSIELTYGTDVTITAEGPDAKKAVKTLVQLIDDKFHEE